MGEGDPDEVAGRSRRIGLEHLGRPEVPAAVERAAVKGGQAARPDVGSGEKALMRVGVDAIYGRLAGAEDKEVGDRVERAHVERAVRTLSNSGRRRVPHRIVADGGADPV